MGKSTQDHQLCTLHFATLSVSKGSTRKGIGGPKTPEGKRRSSLNALKHGLTAKSEHARALIMSECDVDLQAFHNYVFDKYQPIDSVECYLVQKIYKASEDYLLGIAMKKRMLRMNPNLSRRSKTYIRLLRHIQMAKTHINRNMFVLNSKRKSARKKRR